MFDAITAAIVFGLNAILSALNGSSSIVRFDTILHVAFDSNLAFAALLKVLTFHVTDLEIEAKRQHSCAMKVRYVLKSEKKHVVDPTICQKLARALIAKAKIRLSVMGKRFVVYSLFMMVLSLTLLLINATNDQARIWNLLLFPIGFLLFGGIPLGIILLDKISARTVRKFTEGYNNFFNACSHLQKPDSSQKAIDDLYKEFKVKQPNFFIRFVNMITRTN